MVKRSGCRVSSCGKNLTRADVVQLVFRPGEGDVILSQVLTAGRLARGQAERGVCAGYDPAAEQFVLNMLAKAVSTTGAVPGGEGCRTGAHEGELVKLLRMLMLLALAPMGVGGATRCGFAQNQQPTPKQRTTTLTVQARVVLLDVIVTDRDGHVVTDLKRDEFRVEEDRLPQSIRPLIRRPSMRCRRGSCRC